MPIPLATDAPLIVTARLDAAAFAQLDALRRAHFPRALNKVPAHISLFHHLPGAEIARVLATIREACAGQGPIALQVLPPRFLGRGVALAYEAEALNALHRRLAQDFAPWLTPQDRQPFKAHVTIQNKVTPGAGRALFEEAQVIPPIACRVEGIDVWRYLGGPWEAVATHRFISAPP